MALLISSRKLRHYFQAHSIEVLTNAPLRAVLIKPESSGRLLKWPVKLSQFNITYKPQTAIKGQALADFMAEFAPRSEELEDDQVNLLTMSEQEQLPPPPKWILKVDRTSNSFGADGGLVLTNPDGSSIFKSTLFSFSATNKEAEYEELLAGLREAKFQEAKFIEILSDSQLIVRHITRDFQARDEQMIAYLKEVKEQLAYFEGYTIRSISREMNGLADALAKLGICWDANLHSEIHIQVIRHSSIQLDPDEQMVEPEVVLTSDNVVNWMTHILTYLKEGTSALPSNKIEAR